MDTELPPIQRPGRESRDSILARNLLVARLAAGLTQQQLAAAADVSRTTIAQIEAGLSDPRLSTIVELSAAIGISPVLLLSGELELSAFIKLVQESNSLSRRLTVTSQDLKLMSHWAGTGMVRDRVRAARIGAAAAQASGGTAPGVIGAAIGSAIRPGEGTISGALFAELSSASGDP